MSRWPLGSRAPASEVQPCGTDGAYQRHVKWREVPDWACVEAHSAKRAATRARALARAAAIAGHPVSHREAARILSVR